MRRRVRHRDAFGLIGWLFADLLLVLAMLFLASSTVARPVPSPSPTPTPTPSPTPAPTRTFAGKPTPTATATPTPTPTPDCRNTVVLKKNELTVPPSRIGRRATDPQLKTAFGRFKGQQVGLLLTFVHGVTPGDGVAQAKKVNEFIRSAFANEVGKFTISEAYFDDAGALGTVYFDVYLMDNTCK